MKQYDATAPRRKRAVSARAACLPIVALATALACGGAGARRPTAACGLDCTAEELRFRLAADPRDRDLHAALAVIEEQRDRPGAALAALEAAAALGRPLRGGVGGADRARLARLLVARARARVARGSSGAATDLDRARDLGAEVPVALAHDAALAAIAADLRHSDPRRRQRGHASLRRIDPGRAAALAGDAPPIELERTAAWLDAIGARRVLGELLAGVARRGGVADFAAMRAPAVALDRWLAQARWWSGAAAQPDPATLAAALAAGANPCWFPAASSDCDVIRAADSVDPDGPPWEPSLVAVWERDGVRAGTPDQALAWLIVAARAADRGQIVSWPRAVRDHVDVAALAADPTLPPWAGPVLVALDDDAAPLPSPGGLPAGPRRVLAWLAARRTVTAPPPWPELAATIAAGDAPAQMPALAAVAAGFLAEPAIADRRTEDLLAGAIDVAAAAPRLARLFAVLGDPARARALWQRAADADPEDAGIALGLALAMADAGDAPAALQVMTRAAAASGDAPATLYRAARGFAAVGQTLAALTLARQAIELSPLGDEDAPAGLAVTLLGALGRADTARALAPLAALPTAWDLTDAAAAVAAEVAVTADPARRGAAIARLARLAADADPARARLARTALRHHAGARSAPAPRRAAIP